MKNIFNHLKTIHTHKKWVFHYCCLAGIPLQGLTHDLSKYSPTEFFESIKYYQGTSSPINAAKADKGYSSAWFHHKGRNKHHYEYWMDNFDDGGENIIMPYKYWVEMICDYLGAARAYRKEHFSYQDEYNWWLEKEKKCALNPKLKLATTDVFKTLAGQENNYWNDGYIHPDELITKKSRYFILKKAYEVYIND